MLRRVNKWASIRGSVSQAKGEWNRSPGVAKTHYLLLVWEDDAEEGEFKVSHSESMEFNDE